jgi:hypothetical protein
MRPILAGMVAGRCVRLERLDYENLVIPAKAGIHFDYCLPSDARTTAVQ